MVASPSAGPDVADALSSPAASSFVHSHFLQPIKSFAAVTRQQSVNAQGNLTQLQSESASNLQQITLLNSELKAACRVIERLSKDVTSLKKENSVLILSAKEIPILRANNDRTQFQVDALRARVVLAEDMLAVKAMVIDDSDEFPSLPLSHPSNSSPLPLPQSTSSLSVITDSSSAAVCSGAVTSSPDFLLSGQCDDVSVSLSLESTADIPALQIYLSKIASSVKSLAEGCIGDSNCPILLSIDVQPLKYEREWINFTRDDGAGLLYSIANAIAIAEHSYEYSFHTDSVADRKQYLHQILGEEVERSRRFLSSSAYVAPARDSDGPGCLLRYLDAFKDWLSSPDEDFGSADCLPDFELITVLVPNEKINQWISVNGMNRLFRTQLSSLSDSFSPAIVAEVLKSERHIATRCARQHYFMPIDPACFLSFTIALDSILHNLIALDYSDLTSLIDSPKCVLMSSRTRSNPRPSDINPSGIPWPAVPSCVQDSGSELSDGSTSNRRSSRLAVKAADLSMHPDNTVSGSSSATISISGGKKRRRPTRK